MSYTPSWSNGTAGVLIGTTHSPQLSDLSELADAINRRRQIMYIASQDFSSALVPNSYIRNLAIAHAVAPPFHNFRTNIVFVLLDSTSPWTRQWLWPIADADENKPILPCSAPAPAGYVALFDKLNSSPFWTDANLTAGRIPVRAVHINELRQAIGMLTRGRWQLLADSISGMYSYLPDARWAGGIIANDGEDELRAIYHTNLNIVGQGGVMLGLSNVTIRPSTCMKLTADYDCQIELYVCHRNVDVDNDPASWNEWSEGNAWASPGGLGDSTLITSLTMQARQEQTITGPAFAGILNGMIQGDPQRFIIRRSDVSGQSVSIPALSLVVEFDVDTPPN
jgi:hypothetical protein